MKDEKTIQITELRTKNLTFDKRQLIILGSTSFYLSPINGTGQKIFQEFLQCGINFKVESGSLNTLVNVDLERIERVFTNLLSNALITELSWFISVISAKKSKRTRHTLSISKPLRELVISGEGLFSFFTLLTFLQKSIEIIFKQSILYYSIFFKLAFCKNFSNFSSNLS